jgi:uncharacterized membrane protein
LIGHYLLAFHSAPILTLRFWEPKWFDRVPLLIPLSWFTMSWACLGDSPDSEVAAYERCLLAAALLLALDLLLDPADEQSDELLGLG